MTNRFRKILLGAGQLGASSCQGRVQRYVHADCVRNWLVLRALQSSAAGQYVADERVIDRAFEQVARALRDGLIVLDYAPAKGLTMDIPPVNHPLYLQAMVYWCVQMDCHPELLSEAHALLGRCPASHDVNRVVQRLRHEESLLNHWEGTLHQHTRTHATVPMFKATWTRPALG